MTTATAIQETGTTRGTTTTMRGGTINTLNEIIISEKNQIISGITMVRESENRIEKKGGSLETKSGT